jgi:uncharacterized protein (TIGR00159 family)
MLRLTDIVDILVVAAMLWVAIYWIRRARSRLALAGVGILVAVFVLARALDLVLTVRILQGFFAALVLVLVVVFQDDLRRLFEQLAVWSTRRRAERPRGDRVDILCRAVGRLAAQRTGALIVLPGVAPLEPHIRGGVHLGGELSVPLLLSLFDPHSPGHDGAVIVQDHRVSRFAVHLPLSVDRDQLDGRGTRHAAALGLSERCDALCIVVSEEAGSVSVAQEGRLEVLPPPPRLEVGLHEYLMTGDAGGVKASRRLTTRWLEAAASLLVAVVFWAVFIPGGAPIEMTRSVPVEVFNLPQGYVLEEIEPAHVSVRVRAPRRNLLLRERELNVRLDAFLAGLGRRTFEVTPVSVEHPPAMTVLDVEPGQVRLQVRKGADAGG